eukprot:84283_1
MSMCACIFIFLIFPSLLTACRYVNSLANDGIWSIPLDFCIKVESWETTSSKIFCDGNKLMYAHYNDTDCTENMWIANGEMKGNYNYSCDGPQCDIAVLTGYQNNVTTECNAANNKNNIPVTQRPFA